jgi:hypothetical protein
MYSESRYRTTIKSRGKEQVGMVTQLEGLSTKRSDILIVIQYTALAVDVSASALQL